MHVEIHAIQRNGRSLWQVRLGRRVITAPLGRISAERLLETCHP